MPVYFESPMIEFDELAAQQTRPPFFGSPAGAAFSPQLCATPAACFLAQKEGSNPVESSASVTGSRPSVVQGLLLLEGSLLIEPRTRAFLMQRIYVKGLSVNRPIEVD